MSKHTWDILNFAGVRFWSSSLLPACVGMTLPFWLHPPNFTFRLFAGLEFLVATVLVHAGYAFLMAWFAGRVTERWSQKNNLIAAGLCIGTACLSGIHLNATIQLQPHVYSGIFLVYGMCVLFAGILYVVPPLNFYRRIGGEIVLAYSLGLLPLIGAYLIQVGDLTRTVYLAALPVVAITGLWVWLHEITVQTAGKQPERHSLVSALGIKTSGRFGTLGIAIVFLLSVLLAVISGAVNPLASITLILVIPLGKIAAQSWQAYASFEQMRSARYWTLVLHSITCNILALSSLFVEFTYPFPIFSW